MQDEKKINPSSTEHHTSAPKPDSETLHTTDPQEHMEGPVSSSIGKAGHAFDTEETQEEADRERDAGM